MEVHTHVPFAGTRRALRELGKAPGGGGRQKEKKGERKQQERPAGDGRQEPWRLLYSAAARTAEAPSRSREGASDLCRGGGI